MDGWERTSRRNRRLCLFEAEGYRRGPRLSSSSRTRRCCLRRPFWQTPVGRCGHRGWGCSSWRATSGLSPKARSALYLWGRVRRRGQSRRGRQRKRRGQRKRRLRHRPRSGSSAWERRKEGGAGYRRAWMDGKENTRFSVGCARAIST